MQTVKTAAALSKSLSGLPGPVVLVPTMGALHEGHGELIRHARQIAGTQGTVVVSIFVNPTQFGPGEDYTIYPRPLAADRQYCKSLGTDLIFLPSAAEVYAPDHSVFIEETRLSKGLCGASRPGHFRGVCTVVLKLLMMTRPQMAVFGEKDWQQLAIIRRVVRDLNFPVQIIGCPTVRESDGLACSSRNANLSPAEREVAPVLRKSLLEAADAAAQGETRIAILRRKILRAIEKNAPNAAVDYVEIVHPETLDPVKKLQETALIAMAVRFSKTRLIDNILISTPKK